MIIYVIYIEYLTKAIIRIDDYWRQSSHEIAGRVRRRGPGWSFDSPPPAFNSLFCFFYRGSIIRLQSKTPHEGGNRIVSSLFLDLHNLLYLILHSILFTNNLLNIHLLLLICNIRNNCQIINILSQF